MEEPPRTPPRHGRPPSVGCLAIMTGRDISQAAPFERLGRTYGLWQHIDARKAPVERSARSELTCREGLYLLAPVDGSMALSQEPERFLFGDNAASCWLWKGGHVCPVWHVWCLGFQTSSGLDWPASDATDATDVTDVTGATDVSDYWTSSLASTSGEQRGRRMVGIGSE